MTALTDTISARDHLARIVKLREAELERAYERIAELERENMDYKALLVSRAAEASEDDTPRALTPTQQRNRLALQAWRERWAEHHRLKAADRAIAKFEEQHAANMRRKERGKLVSLSAMLDGVTVEF